jgi:type IV fimbrial biogenesis protein FimT
LVELMVGLAIVATVFAWAVPNFSTWIGNVRTRAAAESLLFGLQQTKSDAVTRNTAVRFQLTSNLGNDCTLTDTGSHWVVDLARGSGVANKCGTAPSDKDDPFILHKSETVSNPGAVTIAAAFNPVPGSGAASPTSITLDALGRPTFNAGTVEYTVYPGSTEDCSHLGGDMTCLRVIVSSAGQIRMCNLALTAPNPQAC